MAVQSALLSTRFQRYYPVLMVLVAVTGLSILGDIVVSAYPAHGGDLQWRMVVVGGILGVTPQVSVLLAIVAGLGLAGGIRSGVRTAAAITIIWGIMLIPLVALFALDTLQFRRLVTEANKPKIDAAMLKNIGMAFVFIVVFLWAGLRGWAASARDTVETREEGHGLIVGQGS